MEVVVVCGPSGAGKSTLIKKLIADFEKQCGFSVSHTTRLPRPGERDKVDYFFVVKDVFQKMEFYEQLHFAGHHYGTSKMAINKIILEGRLPILDINIESVEQLQKSELHMLSIFVKPALNKEESVKVLKERLKRRMKETNETEKSITKRMLKAPIELEKANEMKFDHQIINDDLDQAYEHFKAIIKPLALKVRVAQQCPSLEKGITNIRNGANDSINENLAPEMNNRKKIDIEVNCFLAESVDPEASDDKEEREEKIVNSLSHLAIEK